MHVVATAGHVDHGKSSLILRLTGIDPDRWEEEKRRGLTIDLGFAWTTLPSGREIGFVDVPGHERFVRNMLAGVGPVRLVLFVVAADEGWKPQSEEHLEIVDVLGVDAAVVALTKADLVDEEDLMIRIDEIADRLAGTALEGAPVVACSSSTGRGLDQLVTAIDAMVSEAPAPQDRGRPPGARYASATRWWSSPRGAQHGSVRSRPIAEGWGWPSRSPASPRTWRRRHGRRWFGATSWSGRASGDRPRWLRPGSVPSVRWIVPSRRGGRSGCTGGRKGGMPACGCTATASPGSACPGRWSWRSATGSCFVKLGAGRRSPVASSSTLTRRPGRAAIPRSGWLVANRPDPKISRPWSWPSAGRSGPRRSPCWPAPRPRRSPEPLGSGAGGWPTSAWPTSVAESSGHWRRTTESSRSARASTPATSGARS